MLKFERLSEVNLEHLRNIFDILVTLLVLKFERLSEVKEEQPSNILYIFVTLLVSKFPKEIEVKFVRRFAVVELLNK